MGCAENDTAGSATSGSMDGRGHLAAEVGEFGDIRQPQQAVRGGQQDRVHCSQVDVVQRGGAEQRRRARVHVLPASHEGRVAPRARRADVAVALRRRVYPQPLAAALLPSLHVAITLQPPPPTPSVCAPAAGLSRLNATRWGYSACDGSAPLPWEMAGGRMRCRHPLACARGGQARLPLGGLGGTRSVTRLASMLQWPKVLEGLQLHPAFQLPPPSRPRVRQASRTPIDDGCCRARDQRKPPTHSWMLPRMTSKR